MQTKHKINRSLFIFGLTILLFSAACPLVPAQSSPNDIAFWVISNGDTEVYTMKADGSNQTNLTNSAASSEAVPDWSPDGSRIVFARDDYIWVMNADGSNKINLTNPTNDEYDYRPSWSPDGRKIAFVREKISANGGDVYVMNADGSNPVKLTTSAVEELNTDPRWSPDGTKIVFANIRNVRTSGGRGIFVMNADGSNRVSLTDDGNRPDWSPDGGKIAFVRFIGSNADIYVMNTDGTNQKRITNNPALDSAPSWSPDGTKFVFVSNRDGNDEIYTMNADGSNPVRLTNNTVPDEGPRWKRQRTAAPGNLDTTFGNGGKVVTPATPNDDQVERVRIQSDGKIVTLGLAYDTNMNESDSFIVRHNANGTVDTSFGTNGVVAVSYNNNNLQDFFDFVILPDGKLLVVGSDYNTDIYNIAVYRYLANGTRDAGFGTNGVVITSLGNFAAGDRIALQPDGKFVVSGGVSASGGSKVAVVRYNYDGTLDTAFGTGGITQTSVGTGLYGVREVLVQNDGKLLVAGYGDFGGNVDFFVLRLNADGTLDNSFGTSGIVHTDVDNLLNVVGGMVLQSDGKIVINGPNISSTGFPSSSIVRYNANGTLDDTFGTHGIVRITEPDESVEGIALALAIQQNGKILTAGIRDLTFTVARYNSNGRIDTSFGTNGIVTTVVGEAGIDRIYSLAVQPDGKIVAAGGVNNANFFYDVGLVRYLGDPVVQKPSDFDGDGRSDLGVFRPSNGVWYTSRSMQSFYAAQFGQAGDKPAPADYDGDGKTDIAVFREGSFAYFYILNSSNNTFRFEQFGQTGDSPIVVGDWDGDGKADPAVYRAATTAGGQSFFFYRPSAQPGVNFVPIPWGTNGDEAVRGDFDGDGKLDAAVFRPGNQSWYIRNSGNGAVQTFTFGFATDKRVSGDFDGDGKTDIAVFRPADGVWYIRQSASNQIFYVRFGLGTDTLVPADYDGDGKTDVAVYRNGTWYIRQSTGGIRYAVFGASGDIPIASVFVR